MTWSEEQRATKEEAAELLAIAKAQPPTKKRLIASGKGEEQRGEEKAAIETVIGKEEAAKVENRLSRSRRHSSSMLSAYPRPAHIAGRPRRSRSVNSEPMALPLSQVSAESEAATQGMLRDFLHIYDSLPARCDVEPNALTKATSELVKKFRNRAFKIPRKGKQLTRAPKVPVKEKKVYRSKRKQPQAKADDSLEHKMDPQGRLED